MVSSKKLILTLLLIFLDLFDDLGLTLDTQTLDP
jgi:hypothetical protein